MSATAFVPGAADTVTSVAALDGWESVAVTTACVVVPLSPIAEGDNDNVTVGASSSSAMVSVTAAGFDTPLSPDATAETVTDLSGPSVASSFAVTVTTPALAVDPAAIVSVFALDSVKSPSAAFVPAAADTVSVTALLDARFSTAVTALALPAPLSSIVSGFDGSGSDSDSVTVGVSSSSVSVRLAPVTATVSDSAAAWSLDAAAVTVTLRSPTLSTSSFTALIVAVSVAFAVLPAAITIVASDPAV